MNDAILNILPFIVAAIATLFSLTIHEFCHGFAAYLQGDMTARDHGRLTLNPIAHIDPIGTLLIPGILLLTHSPFMIGWAKPVPFNPYNLRTGRWGALLVALAGPFSNLALFFVSLLLLKILNLPLTNFLPIFLMYLAVVNFVLGLFNLLPIPPLDGSKILLAILPSKYDHIIEVLEVYGPYILIGVLVFEYTTKPFIGPGILFLLRSISSWIGVPLL